MSSLTLATRVAARFMAGSYFSPGDIVLYGKWKNKKGRIIEFTQDDHGNPVVVIEPVPKGRKQNVVMGLFKIWRADINAK